MMFLRTAGFLLIACLAAVAQRCFAQCPAAAPHADHQSASSTLQSSDEIQACPPSLPVVKETIEVRADQESIAEEVAPAAHVTQQQLLSSAGTFGDVARYLQVLPGVIWSSDLTNDFRVQGGHPLENLFTVDGVEVPTISHFALAGSNGGFTSMIDSSTIGSVDLHSGAYDAGFSSRMSSLVQIQTRPLGESKRASELTVGISGAGGFYQTNLSNHISMLVSAHRSIINFITNDVGINGAPSYSNAMGRLDWKAGDRDSLYVLSLSGDDSIHMNPCSGDYLVSSSVTTQYAGWRTTDAVGWNHIFSPRVNSAFSATTSVTSQTIGQQYQFGYIPVNGISSCIPATVEQVYHEHSDDGSSMLNYRLQADVHGWLLSAGASGRLTTPDESINQPLGEPSPFSLDAAWSDTVQMKRRFASGETDAFLQAEGSIGSRWKVLAGLRGESFALVGRAAVDPRLSLAYRFNKNQFLHVSVSQSSQLPPMMDLLAYPQNHLLRPIQVRQASAGVRLIQAPWGTLDTEAYDKRYRNESVSAEYPQLMLSNMVDTLGQWFVWLPLVSGGSSTSRGIELTLRAVMRSRAQLLTSATYSRTTYRALDGINRRGSYDLPLVINSMGSLRLNRKWELEARETFTSGRPYTPFNLDASLAQDRGIYDLPQVNALREPLYNRLDLEVERKFHLGRGLLDIHGGADNVFDRHNVLGIVWLPNCQYNPGCISSQVPYETLPQMGLYPALNARYLF